MNHLERITEMADRLPPAEQLKLVEHLAQRLQRQVLNIKKPQSLRGIWKGKFPEDFDVDEALREIRDEWKPEMDFDL